MLYAILSCFCWGASYYCSYKLTRMGVPFSVLITINLPCILIIFIWNFIEGYDRTAIENLFQDKNYIYIILLLLTWIGGNYTIYLAFKEINAFLTTVIEIAYPLVILAIMIYFKEVQFNWYQLLGSFITITGIVIVVKNQ